MSQTIYHVDAFTSEAFRGNPAAVCILPKAADPVWMQKVAAELKLSDSAFLYPTGANEFNLRWFTPEAEVPLCGHATLATAHILWQEGLVAAGQIANFQTKSGLLTARQTEDGWIELDFPALSITTLETPPAGLLEALGAPAKYIGLHPTRYLVELESEEAVRNLQPDTAVLKNIGPGEAIVTAQAQAGADYDFVSRFFAPAVGVNEDPVTGSAHCCLAPYWSKRLGKTEFVARQVSARGGILRVRLLENRETGGQGRVKIAGQAITIYKAQLFV